MPKRTLPTDGVTPSDIDPSEKPDGRRGPKTPRVSIPLKADGSFDLSNIRESSQEKLRAGLAENPHAFDRFGAAGAESIASQGHDPNAVTENHVNMLLSGYEFVERWGIPIYVEQQSNKQVRKDVELANIAFAFTQEQRAHFAPIGAVWLNQVLPDWIKRWIGKGGPGVEFCTGIAFLTWMQTRSYLELWKAKHRPEMTVEGQEVEQQPVNGRAGVV